MMRRRKRRRKKTHKHNPQMKNEPTRNCSSALTLDLWGMESAIQINFDCCQCLMRAKRITGLAHSLMIETIIIIWE